jgi:hypothetical protein
MVTNSKYRGPGREYLQIMLCSSRGRLRKRVKEMSGPSEAAGGAAGGAGTWMVGRGAG